MKWFVVMIVLMHGQPVQDLIAAKRPGLGPTVAPRRICHERCL
jgi:hypothetical protein